MDMREKRTSGRINYRLYAALLVMGICPTIYTTVRVFFLGQLPGEWAYSIAGQLAWVNLLYEIVNEAMILPLFYFVGKVKDNKVAFANCVRTGMLLALGAYAVLSAGILFFAEPLLQLMAADSTILKESAAYIRIESVAQLFAVLTQFALVALVTVNKSRYLYVFTLTRLIMCLLTDTFFVSTLPVSANLGVNGIGYSNILVNALLLAVAIMLLDKEKIPVFSKERLSFAWARELVKVGGLSGVESLVRNVAYMVMIVRIVNEVGEQGTYWVANNFIWGWLLLPVLQLGELIKQETAAGKAAACKNAKGYFTVTAIITGLWVLSIPLWKPFMSRILGYSDVDKLFELVLLLLIPYVCYAFQNVCDATFYGLGKTEYMLFESVVTNAVYYGGAFVVYALGAWQPTLTGIALLFGVGNVFDSVVSWLAYRHLLRKEHS